MAGEKQKKAKRCDVAPPSLDPRSENGDRSKWLHAGPGGRGWRRRAGPGAGVWAAGQRLLAAGCQRWRCAGRARARPCGAACRAYAGYACVRRAVAAGGPWCGRAGRRAAAAGGPAPVLAVRGARARGRAGPRSGFAPGSPSWSVHLGALVPGCGRGPRVFAACACTGVPIPCVGVPMPCVLEATRMRVVRVGVYVACSYGTCARRYVLCHWMRTSARCRHRAM